MTTGPLTVAEIDAAMRTITDGGQKVRMRDGTERTHADLATLESMRSAAALRELQGATPAPVISQTLIFDNEL